MAKTLKTRIKNRYDSLTNWSKTGVELLPGEIALVSVKTQQLDEKTGNVVDVPAVLMKVGGYKKDANGEDTTEIASFSELPWVSALAADVYDWAKNEHAKDVNVAVTTGSGTSAKTETKTLGAWLKATLEANATNAAAISGNAGAIETLNKGEDITGSVANTAKTKIAAALDALDFADTSATTNSTTSKLTYVTKVTQTNGKIAVEKRELKAADLPEITTSMVKTGDTTLPTLAAKLSDMDSKIANFKGGISSKNSGSGNYVTGVSYSSTTGEITVTKGGLVDNDVTTAKINAKAVTTTKIADGAVTETQLGAGAVTTAKIADGDVTDAKIDTVSASKVIYTPGTDPVTLPEKIAEVEGLIADINTAIGGGVHFRGEVTAPAKLDENLTTRSVTINGKSYTANNGDVVIQGSKEYIWVAATETTGTWKELGDLSRVGTVEELLSGLPESARTANQYVTHIAKENGKLVAKKARPLAAEIQYASDNTTDTVYSKIEANAAAIAEKAATDHVHGNITKDGTITSTAVTTATGVLVYDSSNKIQRATAANARTIIGAAESGHNHDTRYVRLDTNAQGLTAAQKTNARTNIGAADAGHTHSGYESQLTNIESNYIQAKKDTATNTYTAMVGEDTIIFDCGGAEI